MERFSRLSTEYVKVPVTATVSGAVRDPTSDTVKLAFVTPGVEAGSGDWQTGSWETQTVDELGRTIKPVYYARCLIGPAGTTQLTVGEYSVWVWITDQTEIPKLLAGQIEIF